MTRLDTAPEPLRLQATILKEMAPHERVLAAISMSEDAREITQAGIRLRNPKWNDARVRHEMLVRLYGAELVARAWGP